jgi:hypothetical protein
MSLYVEIEQTVQRQGLAVILHVVRFNSQEPVVCGLVAGLRVCVIASRNDTTHTRMLMCCTWLAVNFRKITHSTPYRWSLSTTSLNEIYWYGCVQVQSLKPLPCASVVKKFLLHAPVHISIFFQDGNVFLTVLSFQRHVFTLWIFFMLVTNTSNCLFIILLCWHHWNCQCSCSVLLTYMKTPLNFTHANYKYYYATKSNNRASLNLTTVTESII